VTCESIRCRSDQLCDQGWNARGRKFNFQDSQRIYSRGHLSSSELSAQSATPSHLCAGRKHELPDEHLKIRAQKSPLVPKTELNCVFGRVKSAFYRMNPGSQRVQLASSAPPTQSRRPLHCHLCGIHDPSGQRYSFWRQRPENNTFRLPSFNSLDRIFLRNFNMQYLLYENQVWKDIDGKYFTLQDLSRTKKFIRRSIDSLDFICNSLHYETSHALYRKQ